MTPSSVMRTKPISREQQCHTSGRGIWYGFSPRKCAPHDHPGNSTTTAKAPSKSWRMRTLKTPHAYRVDFPADMKVHPVRHISELEPVANDPYPSQIIPPLQPVEIDAEEQWEVEEVLNARIKYQKLQYLIKWTGYDIPDWRDAKDIDGLQAIDIFHWRYPHKPGPSPNDEERKQDW